ncbi:PIN-like domain-containing protein [Bacillus cereus]|uniref:PIN-like domain-containing protein n=1 Tax=Bacillus cereus TaxID=1396 RepID=UPI00094565E6|nr:PIN-like domain-containing protein [Bacillus cereus]
MQKELEKLFIKTKTLEEMIQEATIVVDTNVLLSAYQTKPVTFETILNILQELVVKKRLKIPSNVIREFNENRPNRIKEITNELQQFIYTVDKIKNTQPPKKLNKILPAIDVLEDSHTEKVVELQQEFNKQLDSLKEKGDVFKAELNSLVLKLSDYMDNDPILLKYEGIIRESYFEPKTMLDQKQLEAEGKRRFTENIPPGFRDKTKSNNKYGDLILWLQMCELKEDIIFITFDNKEDWVYKDNKNNVLGARIELVQEYYEKSGGKTVKILHPGKFVELYQGQVEPEVKEDLNEYSVHLLNGEIMENKEKLNWKRLDGVDRENIKSKREELLFGVETWENNFLDAFQELDKKDIEVNEHTYNEIKSKFVNLYKSIGVRKEKSSKDELEIYQSKLIDLFIDLELL